MDSISDLKLDGDLGTGGVTEGDIGLAPDEYGLALEMPSLGGWDASRYQGVSFGREHFRGAPGRVRWWHRFLPWRWHHAAMPAVPPPVATDATLPADSTTITDDGDTVTIDETIYTSVPVAGHPFRSETSRHEMRRPAPPRR